MFVLGFILGLVVGIAGTIGALVVYGSHESHLQERENQARREG